MYLILARDTASVEETWIADLYTAALNQATAEELARALDHLTAAHDLLAVRHPGNAGSDKCPELSADRHTSFVRRMSPQLAHTRNDDGGRGVRLLGCTCRGRGS